MVFCETSHVTDNICPAEYLSDMFQSTPVGSDSNGILDFQTVLQTDFVCLVGWFIVMIYYLDF